LAIWLPIISSNASICVASERNRPSSRRNAYERVTHKMKQCDYIDE